MESQNKSSTCQSCGCDNGKIIQMLEQMQLEIRELKEENKQKQLSIDDNLESQRQLLSLITTLSVNISSLKVRNEAQFENQKQLHNSNIQRIAAQQKQKQTELDNSQVQSQVENGQENQSETASLIGEEESKQIDTTSSKSVRQTTKKVQPVGNEFAIATNQLLFLFKKTGKPISGSYAGDYSEEIIMKEKAMIIVDAGLKFPQKPSQTFSAKLIAYIKEKQNEYPGLNSIVQLATQ